MTTEKFSERLKVALTDRRISAAELSRRTGINECVISQYKKGLYEPKQKRLEKISKILNVSIDWLMGYDVPMEKEVKEKSLTTSEKSLIEDYRLLNTNGQRKADERVHELTEVPKYIDNVIDITPELADCVYYDNAVSAGNGLFLSDEIKTTIRIKKTPSAMSCDYAVRVSGDSMQPRLFDGDVILVKSMPCVDIGEIGIYVINGEAFVKKYGGDRLISLNHAYEPIVLNEYDCVVCLGKVLGKAEF